MEKNTRILVGGLVGLNVTLLGGLGYSLYRMSGRPDATVPAPRAAPVAAPGPGNPTAIPWKPGEPDHTSRPAAKDDEDDKAPLMARLFQVAEPTASQAARIRELWHAHENTRRAWEAQLPDGGVLHLTRQKDVQSLDHEFEEQVLGLITPEQRARIPGLRDLPR